MQLQISKKQISDSLFIIRGLAILLVVVGHVIGSRNTGIRQLYQNDILIFRYLYDFIYTFHMPIFFLLSGFSYTVFSRRKYSLSEFLKSKCLRLLLPLFFWSPIYYIFRSVTGKVEFNFFGIIESLVSPDFIFWFFSAIYFASILGFLCLGLFNSQLFYSIVSIALLLISPYLNNIVGTWFYFNYFYFAGCMSGFIFLKRKLRPILVSKLQLFFVIAASACGMIAIYILSKLGLFPYTVAKLFNGFLSFGTLLFLGQVKNISLSFNPFLKLTKDTFLYLGKISMSIYLLHVMFGAITRFALARMSVLEPSIQFTVGLFVATIFPIFIHHSFCTNCLFLYLIGEKK